MSDWHNHLKHLERKHQELDRRIDSMEDSSVYGDTFIHDLKKQRLHVKDEIAKILAQHPISAGV
jgi:uncharacterized protein YdcH (DUF465 family)